MKRKTELGTPWRVARDGVTVLDVWGQRVCTLPEVGGPVDVVAMADELAAARDIIDGLCARVEELGGGGAVRIAPPVRGFGAAARILGVHVWTIHNARTKAKAMGAQHPWIDPHVRPVWGTAWDVVQWWRTMPGRPDDCGVRPRTETRRGGDSG